LKTLWILGNQLSTNFAGFHELDKTKDRILLIEASSRSRWKPYHKKKLVLIFSAMRHFRDELKEQGYWVDYRIADSFQEALQEHIKDFNPCEVIIHEPTDFHMRKLLYEWKDAQKKSGILVNFLEESLFLVKENEWESLLPPNKSWKLDTVYQKLRRKFSVLIDGEKPVGGKWSYDQENRKPPKKGLSFEEPLFFDPDEITQEVISLVNENFSNNPGHTEGFNLPINQKQALEVLDHFLRTRIKTFGDYQDAMIENLPYMSHSLISSAMNIGLLSPLDVIQKTEAAYQKGFAPLSAAEGFIRQILGWREYIRGIYLKKMPAYYHVNSFDHQKPLPAFYWDGNTQMNCMSQTVSEVLHNGYNHHIQRLMILGNFANLAGIKPQEVADWFNAMYTDAHDWVVLPNVLGMALFADGGIMSTKPYVSTGQYINKMSNYCKNCQYNVTEKFGDKACPFNSLYWNFLIKHQKKLIGNPRMSMMYRILEKMSHEERELLKTQAEKWEHLLDHGLL
jgi:deoxyribodipyrimidine photolyase-related protein